MEEPPHQPDETISHLGYLGTRWERHNIPCPSSDLPSVSGTQSLIKGFADWLEMMLQPLIGERFSSANDALAVLRSEVALSSDLLQRFCRPKHSFITLIKTENSLLVEIPAGQIRSHQSFFLRLLP